MSAKRTKVALDHFNDDFLDLLHVWVSKDSVLALQAIWEEGKVLMAKFSEVEIYVEGLTYIDFPAKNEDEEGMVSDIKIEINAKGFCILTISSICSEAFGSFQL